MDENALSDTAKTLSYRAVTSILVSAVAAQNSDEFKGSFESVRCQD